MRLREREGRKAHFKAQNNLLVLLHGPPQLNAPAVVLIILTRRLMAGKRNVHLLVAHILHDPSLREDIPQSWALPSTVHHGAIKPIYTDDLLQLGAHSMAPVAGALQGTHDLMLGEVVLQLVDGQA